MLKLTAVELRKMIRRNEFYYTLILMIALGIFVLYQLQSDGSIVTIQQGGESDLEIGELFIGLTGIFNMTGFTSIIVWVFIWNMLGRELDQNIIAFYYLNSPNRLSVVFAKFTTALINIVISMVVFSLFMIAGCFILLPESVQAIDWNENIANILIGSASFIALGAILILFAFVFAFLFGGMGIVAGTIGVSLLNGLLNTYGVFEGWLPLEITDFYNNFQYQDIAVLGLYVFLLALILIPLVKRREVL